MSDTPNSDESDPYGEWLGIPPGPRPPRPEILLGLPLGETDKERILDAGAKQKERLDEFMLGKQNELAAELTKEVAHAVSLLLQRAEVVAGQPDDSSAASPLPSWPVPQPPPPPPPRVRSAVAPSILPVVRLSPGPSTARNTLAIPALLSVFVCISAVVAALVILVRDRGHAPEQGSDAADTEETIGTPGVVSGSWPSPGPGTAEAPKSGEEPKTDATKSPDAKAPPKAEATKPAVAETKSPPRLPAEPPPSLDESIRAARAAMIQRDPAAARKHVDLARKAANPGSEAEKRLDQLQDVFLPWEEFCSAVRLGMAECKPGEILGAEGQSFEVVRFAEESLTVRVGGASQRFTLRDVPMALALAIAGKRFPRDILDLPKAAFLVVDPNGDPRQAMQLCERSAQRGIAPSPGLSAELKQALAKTAGRPSAELAQPSGEMAGLVASTRQVLLRLNVGKNVWQRLAEETPLYVGDRLVALPAFRPKFALDGRVTLELVDATSLTLLPPVPKGPPGIAIEFGRVLAKVEGAGGASLRVVVGDRSGVCRFSDADSVAAIEVSRTEASGDPETQPGPLAADLYVTSGKVVWREEQGGKEIELKAPVRLTVSESPLEPVVLLQQPRWVSSEATSAIDQRAAALLERGVVVGDSVSVIDALRELTTHRQREVRWLAMRCLSLVEDYEPVLGVLEDVQPYRFWSDYIDELRVAIFRGPQAAAKIRTAMERHYGPEGAALYELLWKYRPDTLQAEDISRLVDFLDNDSLPFRILSFWNLKNLYHNRTLYYRPDDPAARRQAAIQKWRELLKTSPTPRNAAAPKAEPAPRTNSTPPSPQE